MRWLSILFDLLGEEEEEEEMEWVRSVTVEEDKIELLLKSGGYGGGFVWLLAACPPLTEFGWCGKFVVCKCNFLFKIIERVINSYS